MIDKGKKGDTGEPGESAGGERIDPTKNVLDLVKAESRYQDGMREAQNLLVQAQLKCQEEMTVLRSDQAKELTKAESRRIDEQAQLRAEFSDKLSSAEAKRIDAIRAVDVNAVAVASQRAADQATVLATQVAQTAEALRALVATTANTVNQSQQQLATTLSTRITTLEQAQYKGEGQSGVRDPQMIALLAEVQALRDSKVGGAAKSEGVDKTWGILAAAGAMMLTLMGVVIAFMVFNRGPSVPVSPQVIYVPAPALPAPNNIPPAAAR